MIGERIKLKRIIYGISAQELAKYTGISRKCIVNLELGRVKNPKLDTLIKLRDALEYRTIDNLLRPVSGFEWEEAKKIRDVRISTQNSIARRLQNKRYRTRKLHNEQNMCHNKVIQ